MMGEKYIYILVLLQANAKFLRVTFAREQNVCKEQNADVTFLRGTQ